MILLHEIIQILRLPQDNGCVVRRIVVRNRGRIRATLIDGDFFWQPLSANRFAQERLGRGPIARGRQEKVNREAVFIHGAV